MPKTSERVIDTRVIDTKTAEKSSAILPPKPSEQPAVRPCYYPKFAFKYNGRRLDPGEIILLEDCLNDARLIGLGYLKQFPAQQHVYQCDNCSRRFATELYLRGHKTKIDCMTEPNYPNKRDTAELLETDTDKLKIDNPESITGDISGVSFL